MANSVKIANPSEAGVWPDCFANIGGVPPEDAYPPTGDFYRITNKQKPTRKCLASDYDKDPDLLDMRSGLQLTCSYGVSVQNTIEGARLTLGRFKNATQRRFIAKGSLSCEVGRIKQTFQAEYHHTLWTFKGVEIHKYFSCVEVVEPK